MLIFEVSVADKGGGASRWLDLCIWSSRVVWARDLEDPGIQMKPWVWMSLYTAKAEDRSLSEDASSC